MALPQTEFSLTHQRVIEVIRLWNSHDVGLIASLYSDDFEGTDSSQAKRYYGIQGASNLHRSFWDAFPDLLFSEERILVDGQCATILWSARGTHKGPILKIPPTGKTITMTGVSMLTFSGDKIVRARNVWDVAGLLRSLGFLPEL